MTKPQKGYVPLDISGTTRLGFELIFPSHTNALNCRKTDGLNFRKPRKASREPN